MFHLVLIEEKYGGATTLLPDILFYGMFGVDLFFVISGFVMVAVTRGKFQNKASAVNFIYRRSSRIYPTYWLYTTLVLIIFIIQPSWVNSSQGNQVNIVASFLLLPSRNLPLVIVGWTLIHEMYFYLIFFAILLTTPERYMPIALFIWGLGIMVINISFQSGDPFFKILFHPLTYEFIGGCLLGILHYNKNLKLKILPVAAVTITCILLSTIGYHNYHNVTGLIEPTPWWRITIFGLPSLLLVYCFIIAEINGFQAHSLLIKIGNASYSIYLSHVVTLSAIGKIWHIFSISSTYDNVIMIPVLFIAAICAGLISYSMLEKPLLEFSRKFG